MRVIKVDNGEQKTVEYPCKDINKPAPGLVKGIEFYFINEAERPTPDSRLYTVKRTERLTEDVNESYPHLKNAYIDYEVVQLSNEKIIENLNSSLGQHLDTNYPIWKRIKHADELITGATTEREAYIQSLKDWEQSCRDLRDLKEKELIENNQLPDFNWPNI